MASSASSASASAAALPVFCASDVSAHNSAESCWVSIASRGLVFDVTRLLARGDEAGPLLARAGEDVSHWFDASGLVVRSSVDAFTNARTALMPDGRFPHVAPLAPTSDWAPDWTEPWWRDAAFIVGRLSRAPRRVAIVNSLTSDEHVLDVGGEQTIAEIATKYLAYNAHARGYTWKALDDASGRMRALDMDKTLAENGLADDSAELEVLGIDANEKAMLPVLLLEYDDTLTIA